MPLSKLSRPFVKRFRGLFGDRVCVVIECRKCGTTLDSETDSCDACDTDEVVRYVID